MSAVRCIEPETNSDEGIMWPSIGTARENESKEMKKSGGAWKTSEGPEI
jgi:hypothetical protein